MKPTWLRSERVSGMLLPGAYAQRSHEYPDRVLAVSLYGPIPIVCEVAIMKLITGISNVIIWRKSSINDYR